MEKFKLLVLAIALVAVAVGCAPTATPAPAPTPQSNVVLTATAQGFSVSTGKINRSLNWKQVSKTIQKLGSVEVSSDSASVLLHIVANTGYLGYVVVNPKIPDRPKGTVLVQRQYNGWLDFYQIVNDDEMLQVQVNGTTLAFQALDGTTQVAQESK